jgi:hypothetical protein
LYFIDLIHKNILGFGFLVVIVFCLMRYRIKSPFFSLEPHSEPNTRLRDQLRIQSRGEKLPQQIKMENKDLPYPTGPSLLDNLVPHSNSYHQKPQYVLK